MSSRSCGRLVTRPLDRLPYTHARADASFLKVTRYESPTPRRGASDFARGKSRAVDRPWSTSRPQTDEPVTWTSE